MPDYLLKATSLAVAYARERSDAEVLPEDLLLGALHATAKLGIVTFGPLTLDLTAIASAPRKGPAGGGGSPGPRYSTETTEIFDRAAALARADDESKMRLVHLLAAVGTDNSELMREQMSKYDFDDAAWRAALAEWDRELSSNGGSADHPQAASVMSVDAAAAALGVHAQTIRSYIRSGKLPAYRIAGERAIRILGTDLYGLLEPLEPNDPAADDDSDQPVTPT